MAAPPNAPPSLSTIGEQAFDGGVRRVSRAPEPSVLVRMRALLLDLASDGAPLLRHGTEPLAAWDWLAVLCQNEWGAPRVTEAWRRVLRRKLRLLGTAAVSVTSAAELPIGTPVHVRGAVRPLRPSRLNPHMSYIWSRSAMNTDNVRLMVEEGHDFFLEDEAGQAARVISGRGYLLDLERLAPGDEISIFGHTDRAGAAADTAGRAGSTFALRAGDDLPLLIKRAR